MMTDFQKKIKYSSASMGCATVFMHFDVLGDMIVKSAMITQDAAQSRKFIVTVFNSVSDIVGRGHYDCNAVESVERAIDDMVRTHGLADLDWERENA